MYLSIRRVWPGRQFGANSIYRIDEFGLTEWCFCSSNQRYGECHFHADRDTVEKLKRSGFYRPLGFRMIPAVIRKFADANWQQAPNGSELLLLPSLS